MMPDVSGFDVVEALSEHPETARIPILVVTAKHITAEDRVEAEWFRGDDHGEGRLQPGTIRR